MHATIIQNHLNSSTKPTVATSSMLDKSSVDELQTASRQTASLANELGHLHGFDYLRVFFMMMVLLGHTNFFWHMADSREQVIGAGPNVWDFLSFGVQSTAVPSFILMSMLLVSLRQSTWQNTVERVKKLAYLYGFWVTAWVYYSKSKPEQSVFGWIEFVLSGGGWLFYTFASLIILTPFCWVASRLTRRGQWVALMISIGVVAGSFVWVRVGFKWVYHPYFWLPTCFAMMPFAAAILVPHLKRFRESAAARYKWVAIMLVLGIIAAILEWKFSAHREVLVGERRFVPKHARLSIQFTAVAWLLLSLGIRRPANRVITFFARNSLGIYCIHPFLLRAVMIPMRKIGDPISPELTILATCAVLAVTCSLVSEFLRKAFKQRLI